jgi:enoyl-CoA hydratase
LRAHTWNFRYRAASAMAALGHRAGIYDAASAAPKRRGNRVSVAIADRHAAGVVSLGITERPGKLGAEECRALASAYERFARDPVIYALVVGSQHAVFADGLDVREMAAAARREPEGAAGVIGEMLQLCWQQECFTKPIVSLINGPVEGGGPGVSLYGTHRVAGARYRFTCRATALGLVPMGGLGHVLARLANSVGVYLALTGHSMGPGDALRHGLVTHCVDASHFGAIEARLADADPVDAICDGMHQTPNDASLAEHEPAIARCFSAPTVEDIVRRLDSEGGGHAIWARRAAADLRKRSPLALKASLELLKKARGIDLRSYLHLEHGVLAFLAARPDAQRAILREAGEEFAWDALSLADVTEGLQAKVFEMRATPALALRARSDMQAQA